MLELNELYDVLGDCTLFSDIKTEHYEEVLDCLSARQREYPKGMSILNIGDKSRCAGIVLSGQITASLCDENGNAISVLHLKRGDTFGAEAACSTQKLCPVDITALTDCCVLFLNFDKLLNPEKSSCQHRLRLAVNLLQNFAAQTLSLDKKIRITSQKRLRDKIRLYLGYLELDDTDTVTIPFTRTALADYLSADRSAVTHELSLMEKEGLIKIDGRRIRILDRGMLIT